MVKWLGQYLNVSALDWCYFRVAHGHTYRELLKETSNIRHQSVRMMVIIEYVSGIPIRKMRELTMGSYDAESNSIAGARSDYGGCVPDEEAVVVLPSYMRRTMSRYINTLKMSGWEDGDPLFPAKTLENPPKIKKSPVSANMARMYKRKMINYREIIRAIVKRKKFPMLTGGTVVRYCLRPGKER